MIKNPKWKVPVAAISAVAAMIGREPGNHISAYVNMFRAKRSRLEPCRILDCIRVLVALGKVRQEWDGYDLRYYPTKETGDGGYSECGSGCGEMGR